VLGVVREGCAKVILLRETFVTELTREIDHLESTVARLKPKELDGDSYTTRDMLLNAIFHAKPYHDLRSMQRIGDVATQRWCGQWIPVMHGCRQLLP